MTHIVPRVGHSLYVTSVAFSPDGRNVVSGSDDVTFKLWDVASGKLLHTFEGHSGWVKSVSFSPDGHTILSGSWDRTLRLWDVASGKLLRTFRGHTDGVTSVKFSPTGDTALSGSEDETVKLWDVATGKLLRTFEKHFGGVTSIAFSPDGRKALSGSKDKTMNLWDLTTGKTLHIFGEFTDSVNSVAFSSDGLTALSGSGDTVKVWDIASGKLIRTLGHSDRVTSVAFSPDGNSALSGSRDKTFKLWDVRTGELLRSFEGHINSVNAVAFSPDGRNVISASADLTVKLWDVATGEMQRSFDGSAYGVSSVALSPDGRNALSGSLWDKSLKLWDMATGELLRTFERHSRGVNSVAFSPDGHSILSGSTDHTMKLWDVATSKLLRAFEGHAGEVMSVAFSPDGYTALSGSWDRTLKLWDLSTGKVLRTFEGHTDGVYSVAFSPDGHTVLSGSKDQTLKLWDATTGNLLRTFEVRAVVLSGAFSPDGKSVLSGGTDDSLKLWDVATGELLRTFEGHSDVVRSVTLSPDGLSVLSGSRDSSLKQWNAANGTMMRSFDEPSQGMNSIVFCPNRPCALSGSGDGFTRLWSLSSGEELAKMMATPDGEWLTLTPEGFFNASSRKAAEALSVVRGLDVFGIDRVYDALYRPDLVREKLAGDPHGLVKAAAAKLDLDKVVASGLAPKVAITSPKVYDEVKSDEVTVEGDAVDQGGGIGRVEWRVNGVTLGVEGERRVVRDPAPAGGTTKHLSRTLSLEAGDNTIELVAYNSANLIASDPASIKVTVAASAVKTPPKLYVLAVGVNDYYDSRLHLNFAVPDARGIASGLEKSGTGLYDGIEVKTLTDAEVTTDGLDKAFSELSEKVRPKDVLVFYASGHGKTEDGRYYYLPRDFRYDTEASIARNGIGQDRWQAWFAKIKARKSILIYDTCESGTLTLGTPDQVAMRGGLEQQGALGRLIEATGRTVLTASTSDKPALEGYHGHGVFTYALLDGLSHADRDNDGMIEVSELAGYVDRTVPEITEKAFHVRQLPQMNIQGSDFALARKTDGLVEATAPISAPAPAQPAPATSADVPQKPNYVTSELAKVFATASGTGTIVEELKPFTAVVVVRTQNGWSLLAKDGKQIGYVEEAKVKRLQ